MGARIRVALRWFTRALQTSELDPEIKFLNLAIAIESLFTASSSEVKINALIADCVSNVAKWDDANAVKRIMKDLYGRRSGIVHAGRISQFIDELPLLYSIVETSLWELLRAGDYRLSYEAMLGRLGLDLGSGLLP